MQIHISTADGVPIYLQIVNQIKYLVASGRMEPGEELPAIRLLAEKARSLGLDVDDTAVYQFLRRLYGVPSTSRNADGDIRQAVPQTRSVDTLGERRRGSDDGLPLRLGVAKLSHGAHRSPRRWWIP